MRAGLVPNRVETGEVEGLTAAVRAQEKLPGRWPTDKACPSAGRVRLGAVLALRALLKLQGPPGRAAPHIPGWHPALVLPSPPALTDRKTRVTKVLDLLAFTVLRARTLPCSLWNEESNQCSERACFWDSVQLLPIPSRPAVIYLMDMLEIAAPSDVTLTADLWQPPRG